MYHLKVHGRVHHVEISMYLNMCSAGRYMEISMHLNMGNAVRYMEISCTLTWVMQQSTWKFPCTLTCVVQVLLFTCVTLGKIVRFEIKFATRSDFVVKFNFFRNLASLTSFLTALGKNFIEVADYCQKIGVLELISHLLLERVYSHPAITDTSLFRRPRYFGHTAITDTSLLLTPRYLGDPAITDNLQSPPRYYGHPAI